MGRGVDFRFVGIIICGVILALLICLGIELDRRHDEKIERHMTRLRIAIEAEKDAMYKKGIIHGAIAQEMLNGRTNANVEIDKLWKKAEEFEKEDE